MKKVNKLKMISKKDAKKKVPLLLFIVYMFTSGKLHSSDGK